MTVRNSGEADIPVMMEIFRQSICRMRKEGNMSQWTGGYPSCEIIRRDILSGSSYVICDGERVVGTFALIVGTEPTYAHIFKDRYNAVDADAWIDDTLPYGTIHRIASADNSHGIADFCFAWAFSKVSSLRIDTHRDNKTMLHILSSRGFSFCGKIFLMNGDERLAWQKIRP